PATFAQMAKDLGPGYVGLLPLVTAKVPSEARIISAHKCSYKGRQYVHFVFSQNSRIVSFILTRKLEGESFQGSRVDGNAGPAIYQAKAGEFDLAGFENRGYLDFAVSSGDANSNLQMA